MVMRTSCVTMASTRSVEVQLSYCNLGMLHTWKSKPRNRLFRRALAMRAILCVPVLARASMAAQAA